MVESGAATAVALAQEQDLVLAGDMAAALVNKGAIDLEMFNEATGEQFGVFAKMEPLLPEIRAAYGPQFLKNFEKLIDDTEGGRQRVAQVREMSKSIRAQMAAAQTAAR